MPADATTSAAKAGAATTPSADARKKSIAETLQLDTRLLGMIGVMFAIWIGFDIASEGRFLTPRNLYNLSVQTASVALMAMGMVFVIVMRHIDLSVGSMLGLIGMVMGVLQARYLPDLVGFGHWSIWIVTIAAGVALGALIGALQGAIVAYYAVPAFIVTVGGLLIWRGATWWVTQGQTVPLQDPTFLLLGGRPAGTLGFTWSWALGALTVLVALYLLYSSRKRREQHGFPVKPVWAEFALAGILTTIILGFVAIMTAHPIPQRAAARIYEARGLELPDGGLVHGVAGSVIIVILAALVMTTIANRTRFGRYVFATGGNPDAADLSGVDTKWLTVKVFALMGVLTAISAVVASARLGNATNDLGTLDELRVIAAAVIGGTALAGGAGTIYGAILGALFLQSLQSGMVLVGVDAPLQNIVVGVVLVAAVLVDANYRKRLGL